MVLVDFHPPEALRGEIVILRRYRMTDSAAVKDAIAASLESLQKWMPWAQSEPTDQSVMSFLGPAVAQFGGDAAANYAITLRDSGDYIGGCSLMPRIGPGAMEVGYWVHTAHQRRGIATESARLVTNAAFELPGIRRVEIHCDERNVASANVARTLGFRLDRIMPGPTELVAGNSMIWITDQSV
jgi:RimJ/RimL family protein N-acetyltransferase